jgi:uncharacterized protein
LEPEDVLSEPENDQPGREVIVIFAVIFEGGLAPLSLFLGWWLGHSPLERFTWSLHHAVRGALATVPLVLLFLAIIRWPVGPLAKIKDFCEKEFVPLLAGSSWSDIALIALSAGVGEEMLFRGVLQSSLIGSLGMTLGLVLSSLLFGMLHPISLAYIVLSVLVGVYLGGTVILSENLLTAIVTHTLYDFSLMAYLLRFHGPQGPVANPIHPVDSDVEIDAFDRSG